MQVPLEIAFRDVERTDEIDRILNSEIAKLEKIHDNITSCRVAVEKPHKAQQSGNPYRVRITLRAPGSHEIVVKQEPDDTEQHVPLPAVLRETFDIVQRQLRKARDQQRGQVKTHPAQQTSAVVEKIFRDEGYGFLKTIDGRQIYFHQNSVLHGDFDRLEIGTGVSFVEEAGEEGPQASTVKLVDKPGARTSGTDDTGPLNT